MPDGWFFQEEKRGDTVAFFISKESIAKGGQFQTGLDRQRSQAQEGPGARARHESHRASTPEPETCRSSGRPKTESSSSTAPASTSGRIRRSFTRALARDRKQPHEHAVRRSLFESSGCDVGRSLEARRSDADGLLARRRDLASGIREAEADSGRDRRDGASARGTGWLRRARDPGCPRRGRRPPFGPTVRRPLPAKAPRRRRSPPGRASWAPPEPSPRSPRSTRRSPARPGSPHRGCPGIASPSPRCRRGV